MVGILHYFVVVVVDDVRIAVDGKTILSAQQWLFYANPTFPVLLPFISKLNGNKKHILHFLYGQTTDEKYETLNV